MKAHNTLLPIRRLLLIAPESASAAKNHHPRPVGQFYVSANIQEHLHLTKFNQDLMARQRIKSGDGRDVH
ncbi:hypothetical protein F01_260313 [Burkholderia cenocepacia]|nr:hypothetical protein F01_260313 [Burkholderia cenocepacia]